MSMMELYKMNVDFKRFVDAYCKNYTEGRSIPKEVAFEHKIVKDYAEYLMKN